MGPGEKVDPPALRRPRTSRARRGSRHRCEQSGSARRRRRGSAGALTGARAGPLGRWAGDPSPHTASLSVSVPSGCRAATSAAKLADRADHARCAGDPGPRSRLDRAPRTRGGSDVPRARRAAPVMASQATACADRPPKRRKARCPGSRGSRRMRRAPRLLILCSSFAVDPYVSRQCRVAGRAAQGWGAAQAGGRGEMDGSAALLALGPGRGWQVRERTTVPFA